MWEIIATAIAAPIVVWGVWIWIYAGWMPLWEEDFGPMVREAKAKWFEWIRKAEEYLGV